MKRDTKHQRAQIVNKTLNYIYRYINTDISLDELAKLNSVIKYHFHRIFKDETDENIFEKITSIRLQKAANLLITDNYSTITNIANSCGYASHTSFIKAFKKRFTYTPSQWRKGAFKNFTKNKFDINEKTIKNFEGLEPKIKVIPQKTCAYIRLKGYNEVNLIKVWQRLLAFEYQSDLKNSTQIGIYHDSTIMIPYDECNYIAALEVDDNFESSNSISKLKIYESLCAVFHYEGKYGDIERLMIYIYQYWMPNSGYEVVTLPAYAVFSKNHYLEENDTFSLDFHVPIRVV
ncbi:AraC family transcriptional regulator [Poseidonibacter lekithochrous]|uniref:AraC family transcriptional regulator n=1 Tax=Poseidonibacter lekithochrous TaxID=1904463 RepID=UPI000D344F4A|nr:GyrI-like domain-containing protein [Poseidonibacter lekithochrous]